MTNRSKTAGPTKNLPQYPKGTSNVQPSDKPSIRSNQEAIFIALYQVPSGRVITYGGLARLANLPGAARLVGSCLRELPADTRLPWHRVINAQGRVSLPLNSPGYQEQLQRLQNEGIEHHAGKIKLAKYLWP